MDNNNLVQQEPVSTPQEDMASLSKNSGFENTSMGKKVGIRDLVFAFLYLLFWSIIGGIIWGICDASHSSSGWIGLVVCVVIWFFSGLLLFYRINGKKIWELVVLWLKFKSKPTTKSVIAYENDFALKKVAVPKPDSEGKTNGCLGFLTNNLNGACVKWYKTESPSINALESMERIANAVYSFNDFLLKFPTIDRKHKISISMSLYHTKNFDTSVQVKVLEEAKKKKTHPVAITLLNENLAMMRDLNKFISPEISPELYRFDKRPINLNNWYVVFTIKATSLDELEQYSSLFEIFFQKQFASQNSSLTMFNEIDLQNMLNQYFNGIINFKAQKPIKEPTMLLADKETEYLIYNVTHSEGNSNDVTQSMLENIKDVKIKKEHLEFNYTNGTSAFYSAIGFRDLPPTFDLGWMNDFSSDDLCLMITQNFDLDKQKALTKKVKKQIQKNNAEWRKAESLAVNDEYATNDLFNNKEQSMKFASAINNKEISLFRYDFYAILKASSLQELTALRNSFDERLHSSLDIDEPKRQHYEFKQYDALLSAFPSGINFYKDARMYRNYISTLAIAQSYPFTTNISFNDEGTFIGVDFERTRLLFVNMIDPSLSNSFHCGIFAQTGGGKSKLTQQISLMYSTYRKPVTIWHLDSNRDYVPLAQAMGGMIISTNPNENSVFPIKESELHLRLSKTNPTLIRDYLPNLLEIRFEGQFVINRTEMIQYGTGTYLVIRNKELTPSDFEIHLDKTYSHLDYKTRNKLAELYREIYIACSSKFLIGLFRPNMLIGEKEDQQLKTKVKPTALELFEEHIRMLKEFFGILMINWNGEQDTIIEDTIRELYSEECNFHIVVDELGNKYLSYTSSKDGEISVEELLNKESYPVFNDFYHYLSKNIEREIAKVKNIDAISVHNYRTLLNSLKKFAVITDENGVEQVGSLSDLWNTDNKSIRFDNPYIVILTDYIAKTQENEPDTQSLDIRVTNGSVGRAMFYLLITLFRAESRKNGLKKVGKKSTDWPFLVLIWDEAHNLIKHPMMEAILLRLVKEGRKDNTQTIVITQDVGDITNLSSGQQIMNQLSYKMYLGMGASGLKELDKLLVAIGGLKAKVKRYLINPKDYNENVFIGDRNTKPAGHGMISPNGNDLFQIPMATLFRRIDEIITGSNEFVNGRGIKDLFDDAMQHLWPLSNAKNQDRKMDDFHYDILITSKNDYERVIQEENRKGHNQTTQYISNNNLGHIIPSDINDLIEDI